MKSCHHKSIRVCSKELQSFRTLDEIVTHYIVNHRQNIEDSLNFFKNLSFQKSLEHAAFAKDQRCMRFSHQRRVKKKSLQESYKKLLEIERTLKESESFENIFKIIQKVASSIKGLGELYTYDTALRISAGLGYEPEFVYLHAGTRVGAKQIRISVNSEYIELKVLRKELLRLKAHEVEDLLCIYKNQLGAIL